MVKEKNMQTSLILWVAVAALLSQNLLIAVMSTAAFEEKKTYHSPDPNIRSPPRSSRATPSHGSGGGSGTPASQGGGGRTPPANCGNPPSGGGRRTPTPSPPSGGRGGGYYPSPPTSAGTPPSTPTPSTPSTPTPPTTPIIGPGTPSTPGVSVPSPPFDPYSPPSRGGYYPSPPTYGGAPPSIPTPSTPSAPTIVTPPTTPIIGPDTPITPGISTPSAPFDPYSPPSGGYNYPSPPTFGGGPPSFPTPSIPGFPTILTPPTTPIIDPGIPSTPGIYIPPPLFDPNSPPFPLDYWRTNPALIWGLFGWWATVGSSFGVASTPGFGGNLNLLQALSNPRADGVGELYREGTASLLNSMVSKNFTYSTKQVKDSFVAALSSDKAAAAQARAFKLANEGRLKPKA